MSGNPTLLSHYQSITSPDVTLADGTTSKVIGSRTIKLSPQISLSNMLHLPDFSFNLLFVSQLTRTLKVFNYIQSTLLFVLRSYDEQEYS